MAYRASGSMYARKRKYPAKKASWKRRVSYAPSREEVKGIVRRSIDRAEETKFGFSLGGPTAVVTGTPTMALIFGALNQGVIATTRIGQQVTTKSFELRMAFDPNVLAAARIRVMIIRDKQTNGALPPAGATDWLMDKGGAASWYSMYDPSTVPGRYDILMDKSANLNIVGGAGNFPEKKCIFWKSTSRQGTGVVKYNVGNTGNVTDINKGSIILAVYSDLAANGPSYVFEFAVKFKDA